MFHLHVSGTLYQFQLLPTRQPSWCPIGQRAQSCSGVCNQMEQLFTYRKIHFCSHWNFWIFYLNGKHPKSVGRLNLWTVNSKWLLTVVTSVKKAAKNYNREQYYKVKSIWWYHETKFVLWYLKNLPFPSSSYTHLENIRLRGPNLQVLGCSSFNISRFARFCGVAGLQYR